MGRYWILPSIVAGLILVVAIPHAYAGAAATGWILIGSGFLTGLIATLVYIKDVGQRAEAQRQFEKALAEAQGQAQAPSVMPFPRNQG